LFSWLRERAGLYEKEERRARVSEVSRRSLLLPLVHRAECARLGNSADVFMKLEVNMNKLIAKFAKNESGAALVEYSLLIGLITVAVVATIVLVGGWVALQWTDLQDAVGA
jgi:pilus assembly protein Flp/PilA